MLGYGDRAPKPRGHSFRRLREIKIGECTGQDALPIASGERDVIERAIVLEELRDVLSSRTSMTAAVAPMDFAASAIFFASREAITTFAPSLAAPRATPSPMPEPPPITSTRLSFNVIAERLSKLDAYFLPMCYAGKVVIVYRYNG
jgi:hypothetical protein